MSSLGSSVLVIGHPSPEALTFGVDHRPNYLEASQACARGYYSVLVCPASLGLNKIDSLVEASRKKTSSLQLILVAEAIEVQNLLDLINQVPAYRILKSFGDKQMELHLRQALEHASNLEQHSQYLSLVQEQNQKLEALQNELEERVAKRQRYLYKSRQRLLLTNERDEVLQSALIAIQRATSVAEMETYLNEALVPALYLRWTRIFFSAQESIFQKDAVAKSFSLFHAPLYRHQEIIGNIYFLRDSKKPFTKADSGFLHQVADAAALGLDRILKASQAENLKQQWEATFNAINEPLCILDSRGLVLQWNASFTRAVEISSAQIFGHSPNELLFSGRLSKAQTPLGENSRIRDAAKTGETRVYDVYSQKISITPTEDYYVNIYYDVTDQERMENQLLESAKMAELGTIGSSIAHELNNPLGGMISFIQLIKMHMNKNHTFLPDIEEMEKGAQRCKEIVGNLLGFTRMQQSDEKEKIDLRDVIRRSSAITELQTRSRGISLQIHFPNEACPYVGHLNILSQAIKNLIQNSYEAITENRIKNRQIKGEISVDLKKTEDQYVILVSDNGVGMNSEIQGKIINPLFSTKARSANPGLGLSVTAQIIREHAGQLEIESQPGVGTTAKVCFPVQF